jgi:mono/diheme cytochrome c family protein
VSPHTLRYFIRMTKHAIRYLVVILLLLSVRTVFAAEASGKADYLHYCARCHGNDGKGNGPDANEVSGYHALDLTQISNTHQGTFPRQYLYDIIDGGKRLPEHHDWNSPMPLWGMVFQLKGQEYSAESEAKVKRRVSALVDYVESLQGK